MTEVQELTKATYQARVLALLEALASAMPGVGFLLGGAVAALFAPRVAFAVAGAGVIAVLVLATTSLRRVEFRRELAQAPLQGDATSVATEERARTALTRR